MHVSHAQCDHICPSQREREHGPSLYRSCITLQLNSNYCTVWSKGCLINPHSKSPLDFTFRLSFRTSQKTTLILGLIILEEIMLKTRKVEERERKRAYVSQMFSILSAKVQARRVNHAHPFTRLSSEPKKHQGCSLHQTQWSTPNLFLQFLPSIYKNICCWWS